MKSAVVNTDLEAPYAEYERGLAGLLEKRRSAEAGSNVARANLSSSMPSMEFWAMPSTSRSRVSS